MIVAKKRKKMLEMAVEAGIVVDRWNNIKWISGNKAYRFNFKKNVIRTEVKYFGDISWIRLTSNYISKISLDKWEKELKRIYNVENGI